MHAGGLIVTNFAAPKVTTITLQQLVLENIVIGPVTCNGTEDQLRDCLRGQYNISLTVSAMVAGLSCSTLILIIIYVIYYTVVHFQSTNQLLLMRHCQS